MNDEWKKSLGENADAIHQELVHTIGNLTLIRHNQELGNKKFKEKKDVYENNAGLQIARKCITNHDKWGEDEMKNAAKEIDNVKINIDGKTIVKEIVVPKKLVNIVVK